MGLGCDMRKTFEQRHIFRMLAEFEVADQGAKRSPAEDAVLFLVDLLEESALVEFRSLFDVAQQLLLRGVHHANLQPYAGLAVVHQVLQSAPRAFQLLERGMVHDLVQLDGEQMIDLRNARIDHHLRVLGDGHGAFKHLGHEFLDQVLAALLGFAKPALLDDLIEKARFLRFNCCGLRRCIRSCFSHWNLPGRSHPSACPASRYCPPLRAAVLRACRCPAANRAGRKDACADPAAPSAA